MILTEADKARYRHVGHLTVPGVFDAGQMGAVIADIQRWGEEFLAQLPEGQRAWYVDGGVSPPPGRPQRGLVPPRGGGAQRQGGSPVPPPGRPQGGPAGGSGVARGEGGSLLSPRAVLRKLDNPHHHLACVQQLAKAPGLVSMVEQLIGPGISVYFSQIFFKPPEGGGPKPAHQDNFYFGPNDPEGMLTAWVALDDATLENGCLYFGEGTNLGPVYPHEAPPDEPFNLQLPDAILARQPMTPAPVLRGGVSFHHGNTFHQSGANLSARWRRACALHYVNAQTFFEHPALPYDDSLKLRIT